MHAICGLVGPESENHRSHTIRDWRAAENRGEKGGVSLSMKRLAYQVSLPGLGLGMPLKGR